MQNYGQFRIRIRIGNQIQFRFAMRQWWPHLVAVLRTGCIKTTGHPFQGSVEIPTNLLTLSAVRYLQGSLYFCP